MRDPSQLKSGEISIHLNPSEFPLYPIDSYEDDCRLYHLQG